MPVEDIYALASGKLDQAEDEQLQAALQTVNTLIAGLPVEETPAEGDATVTPAA
jgi:hypothetical protein